MSGRISRLKRTLVSTTRERSRPSGDTTAMVVNTRCDRPDSSLSASRASSVDCGLSITPPADADHRIGCQHEDVFAQIAHQGGGTRGLGFLTRQAQRQRPGRFALAPCLVNIHRVEQVRINAHLFNQCQPARRRAGQYQLCIGNRHVLEPFEPSFWIDALFDPKTVAHFSESALD